MNIAITPSYSSYSFQVNIWGYLTNKWFQPILNSFLGWYLKRLNRGIDNMILTTEGSLSMIHRHTPESAAAELRAMNAFLSKYRKMHDSMEAINFFDRKPIEEKSTYLLDKLYELRTELGIKANRSKTKSSDSFFIEALTEKSKKAVAARL